MARSGLPGVYSLIVRPANGLDSVIGRSSAKLVCRIMIRLTV